MRLAILSDVHGNLPALELMIRDAGEADGYVSLGDTVNYGPWGNECVDLVASLSNAVLVEGNHEAYFLSGRYGGTSVVARSFFDFCYPRFDRFDGISNLKPAYELNGFVFAHTIDDRYIYADTPIALDGNYVVGHSHRQFRMSQPPFELYNPGSVGQNREYINVINYLRLDAEVMRFEPRSIVYDEQVVIREMRVRGYPDSCIEYYSNKARY